jgi:hypothetical protein
MPDVTVHRHGDRWAVREAGAESPIEELPSREAAEMAARQLAAGGRVEVLEEDPTGLADIQDEGAGEPERRGSGDVNPVDPAQPTRFEQPGL